VRYLLDTRVWLWLQANPSEIRSEALEALLDTRNELFLSAVSCWEIAAKYAAGKLSLPAPPDEYVPARLTQSGTATLALLPEHALLAARLPEHHRDPIDRLLVAQAVREKLTLVTANPAFAAYEVGLLQT
jgi:PIN domain nuclease of toxin-antitoxin system